MSACLRQPADRGWLEVDLRWLGGLQAPTPSTDILAVYTHTNSLTVNIRVDLLDINSGDQYRFRLSLWDDHNFANEPFVIDLASDGTVHAGSQASGAPAIWPRVTQDFELDTINISLNRFLIGDYYHVDLATYLPGSEIAAVEIRDIRSDGPPQTRRAPFLLAFLNAFPADTPAQALRRWDGAHTGPRGDRNGLKYVFQAAKQNKIPLTLLDIKKPASLAALNYLEVLGRVRSLSQSGLLLLPDTAYSEPADMALTFSRRAAAGFDLPASPFVYNPSGYDLSGYRLQFVPLSDPTHIIASNGKRLIPLPRANAEEATEAGPSLEVRRLLVDALLSTDPSDLVALGGSLPDSTWGQADMVGPTFRWLDAHPWLRRLTEKDLRSFPLGPKNVSSISPAPRVDQEPPLVQELRTLPANAASDLAWQNYLWLNEPAASPEVRTLRSNYFGQVSELAAAARWAAKPVPEADCNEETVSGGQIRCILANQSYFGILEPQGARLTSLFYKDAKGLHQLVSPSSQFAVGLSDPSEWKPQAGLGADPNVIPGAFADSGDPWMSYQPAASSGSISFTRADGKRTKTFRLAADGLEVEYQLSGPETTRIPLAVDPQAYYFGPVNYRPGLGLDSWTWGPIEATTVTVRSDADLSAQGFVASYPFLFMPEDPNLDYPGGHYLPFPLSVATIQADEDFKVVIGVK